MNPLVELALSRERVMQRVLQEQRPAWWLNSTATSAGVVRLTCAAVAAGHRNEQQIDDALDGQVDSAEAGLDRDRPDAWDGTDSVAGTGTRRGLVQMSVRWTAADVKAAQKVAQKQPPAVRSAPPVDSKALVDPPVSPMAVSASPGSFCVILPWPPTANTATRHPKAGVHYLTQAHRTFRSEVAWIVTQAKASIRGKYRMEVVCHPPDRRRRDFDNIQKTLCDALVKAGAIEDDCLMRELQVTWNDWRRIEVPRVIVRVQELEQRA